MGFWGNGQKEKEKKNSATPQSRSQKAATTRFVSAFVKNLSFFLNGLSSELCESRATPG
jgi:hypothetical protein